MARVPLVPGVTDTTENLEAIASTLSDGADLLEVELLPYNRAAGGKYAACGMTFDPGFDEDREPNVDTGAVPAAGHRGDEWHERATGGAANADAGGPLRALPPGDVSPDLVTECDREGLSWPRRRARLTRRMCEAERVVIEPDERIVFTRTLPQVPPVYSAEDLAALTAGRTLHEGGIVNNVCADWGMVLGQGLLGAGGSRRRRVTRPGATGDGDAVEFERRRHRDHRRRAGLGGSATPQRPGAWAWTRWPASWSGCPRSRRARSTRPSSRCA